MGGYRRLHGTETWHWCANCTDYPPSNYQAAASKPSSGEFCPECLANQRSGECR